ncbi:pyridoxamine 5'-phosphate oxidase [Vulgatibacter sp.]|uniref:pyridoxamine 5'-phosphate oxidase n=1 Tax=Vulgatibacter sp. TaxID=1971226 RepID=UPI0035663E94
MDEMNPIERFTAALQRAEEAGVPLANATALATADANGRPSVRMVLLKGADERGFVFYTNLGSRKARELRDRPFASLCFHWTTLEEQIRVEGRVEQVSDEEADAYFASRPRGSQIGAWASRQSETLDDAAALREKVRALEAQYEGKDVPRPPFWSGFLLRPETVEFWYGKPDRLHDRLVFTMREDGWTLRRLYP